MLISLLTGTTSISTGRASLMGSSLRVAREKKDDFPVPPDRICTITAGGESEEEEEEEEEEGEEEEEEELEMGGGVGGTSISISKVSSSPARSCVRYSSRVDGPELRVVDVAEVAGSAAAEAAGDAAEEAGKIEDGAVVVELASGAGAGARCAAAAVAAAATAAAVVAGACACFCMMASSMASSTCPATFS